MGIGPLTCFQYKQREALHGGRERQEKEEGWSHLKLLALLEVVDVRAHHTSGVILEDEGEPSHDASQPARLNQGTKGERALFCKLTHLDNEVKVALVRLVVSDRRVGADHRLAILACRRINR